MTLTRRKPKTWRCKCGQVNIARTSSKRCTNCGENTKPAPRKTKAKPNDSYEVYELLSVSIHGGDAGACGCCGRPKADTHNYDREHDHRTGKPRGLACYRCNNVLLRNHTLESLRQCVAYLERVDAYYQEIT